MRPELALGSPGMATSSADSDHLDAYARAAQALNDTLKRRLGALAATYQAVVPRLRWGRFDASATLDDLVQFIKLNDDDDRWVTVISRAFREADRDGGVATTSDDRIAALLNAYGVAPGTRAHLTVDDPIVAGMPPTSGFANDPVCTATGHFVEVELDLPLPGRTGPLRWVRTYNSRWREEGPFGRGWSSWASVRAERSDEGVMVAFPDGRRATFLRRFEGGYERVAGVLGELADRGQGLDLEWFNGDRWVFDAEGRIARCEAAAGGTTILEQAEGRLIALRHSAGRSLRLQWDGDRIVELTASDGRRVTYRYDKTGDLVEALTPHAGQRVYRMSPGGLLRALVDADGVEVVRNTYDEDGRVLAQRSPFGRLTRFRYAEPGVTVVGDDSGGPTTTYLHDTAGRLVGVIDDHGARMTKVYDEWGNPVAVSDRLGNTVVQLFDYRGRLLRREEPDGAATSYRWDERDRMITRTDPLGHTVRLAYQGDDRVPSRAVDAVGAETCLEVADGLIGAITDPDGVVTHFAYDADGLLLTVSDASGGTTTFERDATGGVVAVQGPSGERTRLERDERGRLTHRHLPTGGAIRYEWTEAGRLAASVSPAGARARMAYGAHGELIELVDSAGATTGFGWDQLGNLVWLSNPTGEKIAYAYDGLCRLTTITDASGGTWLREYDAEGRLYAVINPEGERRVRTYDERGRVIAEADAAGHTTRYAYDVADRVIRVEDPTGAATIFAYDPVGRRVAVTDPLGATTSFEWSPAGRLIAVSSPLGHVTRYEYDPAGRVAAVVDPTGARSSVRRDASGLVAGVTTPTGDTAGWDYDVEGRVIAERAPDGAETRFAYDLTGRLTEVVGPTGAIVRYGYDLAGRLAETVDPLGGVTRFDYDEVGLLRRSVDPLGGEQLFDYDPVGRFTGFTDQLGHRHTLRLDRAGRMMAHVDGAGNEVRFWRDDAGRVVGWGAPEAPEPEVRFERDAAGRPVRVSEPGRETTMRWDELGRLVGQEAGGLALHWRYDADGRQVAVVHPDGQETSYAHDAAGRLVGLRHPVAGPARLTRGADGLPVRFEAPGLVRGWERHHGRVVGFNQESADGATSLTFEHDAAGRVIAETGPSDCTTYQYDSAGQLIGMRDEGGEVWSWAYDQGGRRVTETGPSGERRFAYDAAGRLVAAESADDSVEITYDGAGRRARETRRQGGEVAYTWDQLGRLTGIRRVQGDQVHVTSLHVDALGDLVGVDGTPLMWDRSQVIPSLRRAGAADVVGAGDPLAAVGPAGTTWLSTDARGTIGGPMDPWGAGPGIDMPGAGSSAVELGYLGELAVDHLLWLRNRAYDPTTAAFLSPDPLPPILGSPTVANPYHYAFNNPLGFLDPLGLQPLTDAQLATMRDAAGRPLWERGPLDELVLAWAGYNGRVLSFVTDHGEEIAAIGVTVAGIALIATGAGAVPGVALTSAGAAMATTVGTGILTGVVTNSAFQAGSGEEFDFGDVAVSGSVTGMAALGGMMFAAAPIVGSLAASAGRVAGPAFAKITPYAARGVTEGSISGVLGESIDSMRGDGFSLGNVFIETVGGLVFDSAGGLLPVADEMWTGIKKSGTAEVLADVVGILGGGLWTETAKAANDTGAPLPPLWPSYPLP